MRTKTKELFVKRKKLAYKEEIAKAKNFLEERKKYYEEIKLRLRALSQEQQKANGLFQ